MQKNAAMIGAVVLALLASTSVTWTQEHGGAHGAETQAKVPALGKFHTTIYKLWHTAWPEKDTSMMASLVPDVRKGVAAVAAAELPGILRDKKAVWQKNVASLQDVATQYESAMAGSDLQAKLDAAENLHTKYEVLARTIRPVLKEIEAFHEVLYMVYHYYLPDHQMEKLRSASVELRARMDTLNIAVLPERLIKKFDAFVTARSKLSVSVDGVVAAVATDDAAAITKAVTLMHTDYQTLEKIFE